MARTIDYIGASILILLVTFVWSVLLFSDPIVSIIFSAVVTAISIVTVRYIFKKRDKPYSYDRLALEFCIQGNEYIIKLLLSAIKNRVFENGCNYILLQNSLIIANFKFSPLGISDMCGICSLSKKLNRDEVFVITKSIDRKAYQIANISKIKVQQVKAKAVYKFLKKHNALPDLQEVKNKFSLSALIETILSRRNFKNYAFSGVVLMLVSFLTPFKIYYIVLGSISVLFAILCLTPLGNGTISSPKIFERMEYESQDEYKRESGNLTHK